MSSSTGPVLLVGTRKGVFIASSDAARRAWTISAPMFLGHIANHVVLDPRNRTRMVLGASTGHLGPTVFHSDDLGATWAESTRPPAFTTGDRLGRSLKSVFWLTPGHPDEPGVWYAGGSPQGLFRSEDAGDTWAPVDGWNDHPMWETWSEYPEENTPDGSMLHSVIVDPRDAAHMLLGLSGGGVFETHDRGTDWHPLNAGCRADFFPDPYPEFGHDPHCVRMHPADPDRLYQQNHCGIYRLDRPGRTWQRIGLKMPKKVGDVGFPMVVHPRDANTCWVFPMDGTDVWPRTAPAGQPAAYRTRNGGKTWQRLDTGLPAEQAWWTIKRQAMTADAHDSPALYVGNTGGELWIGRDEGDSWSCIARHLPEIYAVEVVTR